MIVHQHNGPNGELSHVTSRTSPTARYEAFEKIATRHAALIASDKSMKTYFDRKRMWLLVKGGGFRKAFDLLQSSADLKSAFYLVLCIASYGFPRRLRK